MHGRSRLWERRSGGILPAADNQHSAAESGGMVEPACSEKHTFGFGIWTRVCRFTDGTNNAGKSEPLNAAGLSTCLVGQLSQSGRKENLRVSPAGKGKIRAGERASQKNLAVGSRRLRVARRPHSDALWEFLAHVSPIKQLYP